MFLVYPAVFYRAEEGGYCVEFPDIEGCITEGDDEKEALYMAQDVLGMHLYDYMVEKKPYPNPTPIEEVNVEDKSYCLKEGSFKTLVGVDLMAYAKHYKNTTVRKNVSIPSWLNEMAKNQGINFSQVLQDALKSELDID